jgi:transketolase
MKISFDRNQKETRKKLLKILYEAHTSHIGSCLSAVDIIEAIYKVKNKNEKFVLSNGHAGGALYVILEKYKYLKNANLIDFNVHPDRDERKGIDVSTGSLGQGLPIALGMALANRNNKVYCLISDGECTEGSIWEALRIVHDLKVLNLKIVVSVNGWGAYDPINSKSLENRFKGFGFKLIKVNGHKIDKIIKALNNEEKVPAIIFAQTSSEQFPFLLGQDAHYYVMKDEDYQLAVKILND